MSILSRSIAVLTVAAGIAAAGPQQAAADSFGFVITDDDGYRHRRGGDRHRADRHRHHDRHDRRWVAPPPWLYARPYWRGHHHPVGPRCRVVWSDWYRAYVRVCR